VFVQKASVDWVADAGRCSDESNGTDATFSVGWSSEAGRVDGEQVFRHRRAGSGTKQRKEAGWAARFDGRFGATREGRALEGNKAHESNGQRSGGNAWRMQRTFLRRAKP
jgi:hypothetical protein